MLADALPFHSQAPADLCVYPPGQLIDIHLRSSAFILAGWASLRLIPSRLAADVRFPAACLRRDYLALDKGRS
jgi:hypothetical protein